VSVVDSSGEFFGRPGDRYRPRGKPAAVCPKNYPFSNTGDQWALLFRNQGHCHLWVPLWREPTSQHGLVSLFVVQGTATPHGKRALLSAEISTVISEDLHDQQMREKGECCTPHRKQISTTANRTLGASAAPVRASCGGPHLERPASVQPY
jgi:hypothetical protein